MEGIFVFAVQFQRIITQLGLIFVFSVSCYVVDSKEKNYFVLPDAKLIESAHYAIYTTATEEQTLSVITAVEALYQAYAELFGNKPLPQKMQLMLYKDRSQLRENNRSAPGWAEAYYIYPCSYAYYAEAANPHHWMMHEVTHQLMRELSGYDPSKWLDEGIASYFGSSKLSGSRLLRGEIDASAYPIWWLSSYKLTGDLQRDKENGQIIPLEQIVTNTGPDINNYVNPYYIHFWSITHFLFHYRDGIYAENYKKLIASGGDRNNFVRLIGPFSKIEKEWYSYLMKAIEYQKKNKQ